MLSVTKRLVSAPETMRRLTNKLVKVLETVHYITMRMLDSMIAMVDDVK